MKRIHLIFLLVFIIMAGNAQNGGLRLSKKGKKAETTKVDKQKSSGNAKEEQAEASSDSEESNTGRSVSSGDYQLIESAIDNAFLVIKASYNVRDKESGSNVSGNDFFGTVYSVAPLLSYGFGVDNRFLKPWKADSKYDANKYGDDLVSVDKREYKRINTARYVPYTLNKTTGEKLAPDFYHVTDTSFQNLGLRVELGNGAKSGYMVWFHVNPENGSVRYNVVPTDVTFNENSIFNVRQPNDPETVIGGAFLNLNAGEPGCLRLNLMGVARLDPYGSGKWELVKMQSQPAPPAKAKSAESAKHTKEEAKPANDTKDESIIPDQSNTKTSNKDNKKKSEKGNSKSKDSKSSKKSDKNN